MTRPGVVRSFAREREAAVRAVREAALLARHVQATSTGEHATKADSSPVTVADLGVQALVTLALGDAFGGDPIVGEEDAAGLRAGGDGSVAARVVDAVVAVRPDATRTSVLDAIDRGGHAGGSSGRHWALDPVDGTKGFLRGEQYAIALALIEDGEVVLGVLGCPNLPSDGASGSAAPLGTLFAAERGGGAFQAPLDSDGGMTPIRVAETSDAAAARWCESVEAAHSDQGDAARVAALLGITAPPLRMDSQCKYGVVARGEAAIYLRLPRDARYRERIWDHAAGALIVREAGGRVTDVSGAELDFSIGRTLERNSGVVATNGRIHDAVLEAVAGILAP